ncbi:MAG: glycosyltransferase family 2 protein, partial [Lachnospiraceae bacterium]|nr:glycosyltransferase family 2 protein [Lachnospiraceae bacterium]
MKYRGLQKMETEDVFVPAVSVIITVYNGEKYLTECLESIFAQTLKNIEIICVDDASSDNTPQILDDYRDKITVTTNTKNCMAGESRNRGLQKAAGEYVIFLDADDVFEPDMLEKAYVKAKSCEADICIFREDLFSDNIEKRSGYAYTEPFLKELETRDFFSPKELPDMLFNMWNGWAWDKIFRREFVVGTKLKFQKLQSTNDAFFVHAAMASATKISLLSEVLVHHRTGNRNSVSNTRDKAWESCLVYLKELRKYLQRKELFATFARSYLNWTLEFLYWNYQTLNEMSRGK